MQTEEKQEEHFAKEIIKEDKTIETILNRADIIMDAVIHHDGQVFKAAIILQDVFKNLRDRLNHYFDLQEHHGILEDLVEEHPRIQHSVRSVYAGDNHLLETCNQLFNKISQFTMDSDVDEMRHFFDDFKNFKQQLRELKDKTNNLIMDTYNLDIGSCD